MLRSYKEWNGVYVSVSHSLILSLETDWETILLGHKWNWNEDWKCSQEFLIFVLKFATPRYTLLFLNSEIYIVHVINWNEVDPLIFHCICFVCDTNMYFPNSTWWDELLLLLDKANTSLNWQKICQFILELTPEHLFG